MNQVLFLFILWNIIKQTSQKSLPFVVTTEKEEKQKNTCGWDTWNIKYMKSHWTELRASCWGGCFLITLLKPIEGWGKPLIPTCYVISAIYSQGACMPANDPKETMKYTYSMILVFCSLESTLTRKVYHFKSRAWAYSDERSSAIGYNWSHDLESEPPSTSACIIICTICIYNVFYNNTMAVV